jgi:phage-related protein
MPDYPDIQMPSGCEETTEDPSIRTEFESGIVQTRARFTRARRTWGLKWDYMKGADYRILRSFYDQMHGGALSFMWPHPTEETLFDVRFKGEIKGTSQSFDFWSVTVTLEQV